MRQEKLRLRDVWTSSHPAPWEPTLSLHPYLSTGNSNMVSRVTRGGATTHTHKCPQLDFPITPGKKPLIRSSLPENNGPRADSSPVAGP